MDLKKGDKVEVISHSCDYDYCLFIGLQGIVYHIAKTGIISVRVTSSPKDSINP
jgi:hypothetical protein